MTMSVVVNLSVTNIPPFPIILGGSTATLNNGCCPFATRSRTDVSTSTTRDLLRLLCCHPFLLDAEWKKDSSSSSNSKELLICANDNCPI